MVFPFAWSSRCVVVWCRFAPFALVSNSKNCAFLIWCHGTSRCSTIYSPLVFLYVISSLQIFTGISFKINVYVCQIYLYVKFFAFLSICLFFNYVINSASIRHFSSFTKQCISLLSFSVIVMIRDIIILICWSISDTLRVMFDSNKQNQFSSQVANNLWN